MTPSVRSLIRKAREFYPHSKRIQRTYVRQMYDLQSSGNWIALPTTKVSLRIGEKHGN